MRSFSMFRLSASNVMVDAVKKAEDGEQLVLRIHEFAGVRTHGEDWQRSPYRSLQECDLMEREIGDEEVSGAEFMLKPYEIKTFLIRLRFNLEWLLLVDSLKVLNKRRRENAARFYDENVE